MLDGHEGESEGTKAGEVSMRRALDLCVELDSIANAIRIQDSARDAEIRELRALVVGLLSGDAWARSQALDDPEIAKRYADACRARAAELDEDIDRDGLF